MSSNPLGPHVDAEHHLGEFAVRRLAAARGFDELSLGGNRNGERADPQWSPKCDLAALQQYRNNASSLGSSPWCGATDARPNAFVGDRIPSPRSGIAVLGEARVVGQSHRQQSDEVVVAGVSSARAASVHLACTWSRHTNLASRRRWQSSTSSHELVEREAASTGYSTASSGSCGSEQRFRKAGHPSSSKLRSCWATARHA